MKPAGYWACHNEIIGALLPHWNEPFAEYFDTEKLAAIRDAYGTALYRACREDVLASAKWKTLAHEICPDEDASDFAKARLIHDWMATNLVYDKRVVRDDLPYRWAENGSGEFSMWNTHLGTCYEFSNVYAIMCRELGVPCRIVSDDARNHCYNAVYLRYPIGRRVVCQWSSKNSGSSNSLR